MLEQMTIDEVNTYIHEEIMGLCDHRIRQARSSVPFSKGRICDKCHEGILDSEKAIKKFIHKPNYCSDDSPRRLLNEVVDAVMQETRNPDVLAEDILLQFEHGSLVPVMKFSWLIHATAEQIARACVETHKESKNNVQTKNKI